MAVSADGRSAAPARELALDRLAPGLPAEVLLLRDARVGEGPIRAPHRHDYHELIWLRSGSGEQFVDGEAHRVRPGTVTIIGRAQVHQFLGAAGMNGAILRFGDELVTGGAQRIAAGWLPTGTAGRTIAVPAGEQDRLEQILLALHAEIRRPRDSYSADLQGNLIAVLLRWLERWYDASRTEYRDLGDAAIRLHRGFATRLERDFARHHDAAHYADALGVPRAALSRTLVQQTGRATKDLILDRVMLEAARLLRFTDQTVGEIAYAVGFDDQLYFSRAFKRHFGVPPVTYRSTARGF